MDYRGTVKSKIKKQGKRDDHSSKNSIKVVYISTPMKVKTSASRFRALVQELTGRESDIVRIMESNGTTEFEALQDHNELELLPSKSSSSSSSLQLPTTSSSSPVSSESNYLMEPNFDDLFGNQLMEEQFLSLLANSSNLPPCDYSSAVSEFDVLGDY